MFRMPFNWSQISFSKLNLGKTMNFWAENTKIEQIGYVTNVFKTKKIGF